MFRYGGNIKKLHDASKIATWLLTSSEFYDEISKIKTFTHSNEAGKEVAEVINNTRFSKVIRIKTYKSLWPWSKAIGYYTHKRPNDININIRKLNTMTVYDCVANFHHERTHALGYSHKGNNRFKNNNLMSVPYMIGYLAGSLAERKFNEKY